MTSRCALIGLLLATALVSCTRPATPTVRYVIDFPSYTGVGGSFEEREPQEGFVCEILYGVGSGASQFRLLRFSQAEWWTVSIDGKTEWLQEAPLDDPEIDLPPMSFEEVLASIKQRRSSCPDGPLGFILDGAPSAQIRPLLEARQRLLATPNAVLAEFLRKDDLPTPRVSLRFFDDRRFEDKAGTPVAPFELHPDGVLVIELPSQAAGKARGLATDRDRLDFALRHHGDRSRTRRGHSRTTAVVRVRSGVEWRWFTRLMHDVALRPSTMLRLVVLMEG